MPPLPTVYALRRALPVLLPLLALASGCGGGDAASPAAQAAPPSLVEVATVRQGTLTDTWSTLGDVRALGSATLAAGADGAVVKVAVREGDRVNAGDLLVEVDPALASARLAAARAAVGEGAVALAAAQRQLSRASQVSAGVMAPSELEGLQSAVDTLTARQAALEAQAREAEATLARHRVRAPFDGVVASRRVDPGDWAGPGTPVLGLVAADAVEVHVDVPPEVLARLRLGMVATLRGAVEIPAEIVAIVPALDASTRTARVRLAPQGEPTRLIPGATVQVVLPLERGDQGVIVPRDALLSGASGDRVIKVVDGAAVSVNVAVIAATADDALVSGDGLAAGDAVVVRGNERLRPGASLKVVATEGSGAP